MRLAALPVLLLLSGCALARAPESVTVLRAAPRFEAAAPALDGVIAVAPVMARGVAAERRYAYVDRAAPGEVKQAATLFWEEPPPRIAERALVDGLRALTGAAVGPEAAVAGERRLTARLERFEEVTGGHAAEAAVALDVTLLEAGKARLAGRYCGAATMAGSSPTQRAAAFEAALAGAITQLAADIGSGARTPSRPC